MLHNLSGTHWKAKRVCLLCLFAPGPLHCPSPYKRTNIRLSAPSLMRQRLLGVLPRGRARLASSASTVTRLRTPGARHAPPPFRSQQAGMTPVVQAMDMSCLTWAMTSRHGHQLLETTSPPLRTSHSQYDTGRAPRCLTAQARQPALRARRPRRCRRPAARRPGAPRSHRGGRARPAPRQHTRARPGALPAGPHRPAAHARGSPSAESRQPV